MKYYLGLILFLFIIPCLSQEEEKQEDTLKIDFNTNYDRKSRGFLILRSISEMQDGLLSKVTFPDLSEVSDTVFGQIYFTGNNHDAIKKGILVLVGNSASESPLFWVDRDNDLNFLNESKPILFSEKYIDISIPNIDDTHLKHLHRLHKPDTSEKEERIKMLEQYITKGEPFADFYFDERRNIKVADVIYQQDSLRVGLMDFNINGKYNDIGSDRIVFGEYGGELNGTDEASGAVIIDSKNYFQTINHVFEVIDVSIDGNYISIKSSFNDTLEKRITEGHTIPDYTFKLLSGKETSMHELLAEGKFLYLNFWATWCAGCHMEMNDLEQIHTNYSDKILLVSLNDSEGNEAIESFLEKHEPKWLNGHSTLEINKELFVYGLPRNILIDPSGKIIKMNIHPSKLLNRIDEY